MPHTPPVPTYRTVDLIRATRDRRPLREAEIRWLVDGFLSGAVPDYQMSAWLMAVMLNGITDEETVWLTQAMLASGTILDWSDLGEGVVDKHSTGGVGDKLSLLVVPIAAAAGLSIPKLSGRGLGHSGGTLDKLEAIPGMRTALSRQELRRQLERIGCAISAATDDLAPGDKQVYALRDAIAAVESIPLIASSIMSKKLAGGAPGIVLDVKLGSGAMMTAERDARLLAERIVTIGRDAGRRTVAIVTRNDEPIGAAVGNALEVAEAVEVLRGEGPDDVREAALAIAGAMMVVGMKAGEAESGARLAARCLDDGSALRKFRELVTAQGGHVACIDDPSTLPRAPVVSTVTAGAGGQIAAIDAREVGLIAMSLGAGRNRAEDEIHPGVGILLRKKVSESVAPGETLAEIHARSEDEAVAAVPRLRAAYRIADGVPPPQPIVVDVIGG